MALRTWIGNGEPLSADAFGQSANWAEGVVPVTGDDLLFSSSAGTYACESTGFNAGTGIALGTMYLTEEFKGDIGDTTGPLDLKLDCDYVFIDASPSSTIALAISNGVQLTMRTGTQSHALHLGDELATDITRVLLQGGYSTLDQVTCSDLFITSPSKVELGASVNYTELMHIGGTTNSNTNQSASTTRTLVTGGTLTKETGSDYRVRTTGGRYIWSAPNSTITFAEAMGGVFSGQSDDKAKTITWPVVGDAGVMNLRNNGTNITLTNPALNMGGSLVLNKGQREATP